MPYKIKLNTDTAEYIPNVAAMGKNDEYQDYGIYELMTGNDTFIMDNFYYQGENDRDGNPQKFISAETALNGGTWGKPLSTGYYGPDQDSRETVMLPFANRYTMPHPYLDYDTTQKRFLREFPVTSNTYAPGYAEYLYVDPAQFSTEGLIIDYDSQNENLRIYTPTNPTKSLFTKKAYPCIMVDLQAAGGNGGCGAYFQHQNLIGKGMAVAGGGGGGSGAFASLSVDLAQSAVLIYKIGASDGNPGFDVSDGKSTTYRDHLILGMGHNGDDGSAKDTDTGVGFNFVGTGGTGGSGGTVSIVDTGGNDQWSGDACRGKKVGNIYVVDTIAGASGQFGSATTSSGNFNGRTNQTVAGGAPRRQTYLTSSTASSVQVVKAGTDDQTFGGVGERYDDTKPAALAGGGGGAASIMTDGGSWPNAAGIGAGGHGASGYTGMATYVRPAGGPAAIWVAYIAQ
jgi:hypothetical protein